MGKLSNGSEYERLKEELRRLKRQGAPWYFESALHQRLHGGDRRRRRLRPISIGPVLVVAVVTLAVLGFALYAVLMHSNLFPEGAKPALPADTLSVAGRPDTMRTEPLRTAVHPGETSRAGVRTPRSAGAVPDTLSGHRNKVVSPGADSGVTPPDTSVPRRDTVSHGADSTGRPIDAGGRRE